MKFTLHHESRIGHRRINQDRLEWAQTPRAVLMVLADGMGGHRSGEIAAQIAVQHIDSSFRRRAAPALDDPKGFLTKTLADAHRAINDYATLRAIAIQDAPRTTCVACVIQDGVALWAHVGDSRLYHIRDGEAVTRTQDHSRVQLLLAAGAITPEEAAVHPQRNLVFNCLGGDLAPRIDVSPPARLEPGDVLALCSDGAWAPTADRFAAAFALPPERAVPLLLDAAEAATGDTCDNLSLIALRWESSADDAPAATRTSSVDTQAEDFASAARTASTLTDDEIERAVAEIRRRIQNRNPTGASR